jgi:hypothetical protein
MRAKTPSFGRIGDFYPARMNAVWLFCNRLSSERAMANYAEGLPFFMVSIR